MRASSCLGHSGCTRTRRASRALLSHVSKSQGIHVLASAQGHQPLPREETRRGVLTLLSTTAVCIVPVRPCLANILEAPAAFWKSRQRQNGGIKLLAPLRVAQKRLNDAAQALENVTRIDLAAAKALEMVRSSSLNCYEFEPDPEADLETRTSLFTQRYKLSDPCTFRLILKNVTDLSSDDVKAHATEQLDTLIRSYQLLDSYLEMAREGNTKAFPLAREQLQVTLRDAVAIEVLVKDVLGV